jgi:hypothetical protein
LVDLAAEAIGERYRDTPMPNAPRPERVASAAREAMSVPSYHPPITDVVLGRDGSVWLQREPVGDHHTWVGIDAEGRVLGTVEIPADVKVLAARADFLMTVELDAMDVPSIVRYGLAAGER